MSKSFKVLILGATGRLGSVVAEQAWALKWQTHGTFNNTLTKPPSICVWHRFSATSAEVVTPQLQALIGKVKPDVIINCLRDDSRPFLVYTFIPTLLARITTIPVIHISSNAVFPPSTRQWDVLDTPAPTSEYGLLKLLGEHKEHLVLRTSFIGPPAGVKDPVPSLAHYARKHGMPWNGVTNRTLAEFICLQCLGYQYGCAFYRGIVHLCSKPQKWDTTIIKLFSMYGKKPRWEGPAVKTGTLIYGVQVKISLNEQIKKINAPYGKFYSFP